MGGHLPANGEVVNQFLTLLCLPAQRCLLNCLDLDPQLILIFALSVLSLILPGAACERLGGGSAAGWGQAAHWSLPKVWQKGFKIMTDLISVPDGTDSC